MYCVYAEADVFAIGSTINNPAPPICSFSAYTVLPCATGTWQRTIRAPPHHPASNECLLFKINVLGQCLLSRTKEHHRMYKCNLHWRGGMYVHMYILGETWWYVFVECLLLLVDTNIYINWQQNWKKYIYGFHGGYAGIHVIFTSAGARSRCRIIDRNYTMRWKIRNIFNSYFYYQNMYI